MRSGCSKAVGAVILASALASGAANAEPVTVAALAAFGLGIGVAAGSAHHAHHRHHAHRGHHGHHRHHTHHTHHGHHGHHAHHGPVSGETWEYIAQQAAQPAAAKCTMSAIVPARCTGAETSSAPPGGAMPSGGAAHAETGQTMAYGVMTMEDWKARDLYRKWAREGHQEASEIWSRSQETPRFDPITGHVRMWNEYLKKWFY